MTVDVNAVAKEKIAKDSAYSLLRLMHVLCQFPIREKDRKQLTEHAVKWFLNVAEHMGVSDAHVQAEFVNSETSAKCVYTPLNESARIVKDYLLQCELESELAKG